MTFALSPQAEAAGYHLLSLDSVGSTNAEALERGRAGDNGLLWVVTKRQNQGRGRRGRAWGMPDGNLAATLLLTVDCEPGLAATLGFVAGLAIDQAIRLNVPFLADGASPKRLGLKWPNDVLLDDKKLVGILLESELLPDRRRIVAIGIGVNVVAAPDLSGQVPARVATSLADVGATVSTEGLFETLSGTWLALYEQWSNGQGMAAVRKQWLDRAYGLGERTVVRLGDETLYGYFETIDDAGQLVLKREDGSHATVTAGDVYFGSAATALDA